MEKHSNILNSASNLLGTCFVIIAGLKLTNSDSRSLADEVAWISAISLLSSIYLAYFCIRQQRDDAWQATWADRMFIAGVAALALSIGILAFAMQ